MAGEITRKELSPELYKDLKQEELQLNATPADIEISGRTLVNLLGRAGNAIYKQGGSEIYYAIDKTYDKDWFMLTINQSADLISTPNCGWNIPVTKDKYYISLSDVNTDTLGENAVFTPWHPDYIVADRTRYVHKNNGVQTSFGIFRCIQTAEALTVSNVFNGIMEVGHQIKIKNCRIYEITEQEYNFIKDENNISGDEIVEKYPYVDDVKCVVNPYVECKENLLDGIKWNNGYISDTSPTYVPDENSPFLIMNLPVTLENNQDYTIKLENIDVNKYGFSGHYFYNGVRQDYTGGYIESKTIRIPEGNDLMLFLGNSTQDVNVTNELKRKLSTGESKVLIYKGTTPKTYDECHNSRMMFETKLYEGEKITRDNFGRYAKNSEWEEVDLDVSKNPKFHADSTANAKQISFENSTSPRNQLQSTLIRYDGKVLTTHINGIGDKAEGLYSSPEGVYNTNVYMSVPNSLTGWGENYTPTPEEVRAFFLGWTMYCAEENYGVYNGTGTKCWVRLWCGIGVQNTGFRVGVAVTGTGTDKLPTEMNDRGYTPYKLIYKKEAPTIEEVKVHGSLVIKDGVDVNVSSGLVLGEKCKINKTQHPNCFINSTNNYNESLLSFRCDEVLISKIDNDVSSFINMKRTGIDIVAGRAYGKATDVSQLYADVDYLIYRPDTVTSFPYTITSPQNTQEILEKTIEELSNINEKLSAENRELHNKIESLPQVSNPNLLINGDFRVNQRGKTEYVFDTTPLVQYSVDRWITHRLATDKNKITVLDKGIQLESLVENANVRFRQKLEEDVTKKLLGKTLTLSARILSDCTKVFFNVVNRTNTTLFSKDNLNVKAGNVITFTFKVPMDVTRLEVQIGTANPNVCIVEWMKLEIGDKATPFSPRPYAEELAMCQRFYQKGFVKGSWVSDKYVVAPFVMQPMRIPPTAKIYAVSNNQEGYADMWDGSWKLAQFHKVELGTQGHVIASLKPLTSTAVDASYKFNWTAEAEIY